MPLEDVFDVHEGKTQKNSTVRHDRRLISSTSKYESSVFCQFQQGLNFLCFGHPAERAGAGGDEGGSGVGKPQQAEQHLLPRIVQTVLQRVALRADAGLGEVDEQFPQRGHIIAFLHRQPPSATGTRRAAAVRRPP